MRWVDLGLIAVYLVGITLFGARFRHGQKTLRDYFLGGRTAPWWAITLSIVSAETIERQMGRLSDGSRAKILGPNAARLFGLSPT